MHLPTLQVLPLCLLLLTTPPLLAEQAVIWIGTSTSKSDAEFGIFRTTLDLENGKLSTPKAVAEVRSPGFLNVRADTGRVYSVCSLEDGGGVAGFQISKDGKSLRPLGTQTIGNGGAAHISTDNTGRLLFTAQYGAGSVAVFPISENGEIQPRSDLKKQSGSGPNQQRQKGPHPHWTGVSPDNQYLFVPDLGADKIFIYRIDHDNKSITPHGFGTSPPGAGPRHMKFHQNGKIIYVLNELDLSITVYDYTPGKMVAKQTISTLPKELRERPNKASEIRIHPSGKFVYASNRGHDSIAVFSVDEETGKLTFVEREPIRGSWPRNFNIDPSGKWLVAAGRHSNTLTVFSIDQSNGRLVFTGNSVNCPSPICVEFN